MTWWQTLLVSVLPVLLTLGFTNWAEGRRRQQDLEQREREQRSQEQLRADERRHLLVDTWRTDKMKAHQDLMVLARRLWHSFVDAGKVIQDLQKIHTSENQPITPEIEAHLRRIHDAFRPLDGVSKEMDTTLTAVQMFCSDEAQQAALRFEHQQQMVMLNLHGILAGNGHRVISGKAIYERWKEDLVPITAFVMIEYSMIVRRDLQPPSS